MPRQLGKQALLDAAAVLMDERGVDNVTVHEISQASTPSTIPTSMCLW